MPSRRFARLRASLLGSGALLALLVPASNAGAATLRAVGDAQMPPIQSVQLQPEEFTDVDNQLISTITSALAARGIQVDPNATMVLSFDTEDSDLSQGQGVGSINDTELTSPGEDQDLFPDSDIGPVEGEFPTTVLGGGASLTIGGGGGGPAAPQPGPRRLYSLDFTLTGGGDVPIWQGSVRAKLPAQDPLNVAQAMVTPLVANIGQTVSPQRVKLQVPPPQ